MIIISFLPQRFSVGCVNRHMQRDPSVGTSRRSSNRDMDATLSKRPRTRTRQNPRRAGDRRRQTAHDFRAAGSYAILIGRFSVASSAGVTGSGYVSKGHDLDYAGK